MTANDRGHRNNLNGEEESLLKECWTKLIEKIDEQSRSTEEMNWNEELFLAIGGDHPDMILLRYLRARKWNVDDALKQFLETILWRRKSGLNQLIFHGEAMLDEDELRTGKTFYLGFDRANRPINYISARAHLKGEYPAESSEKLTVLTMEIGRKLLRHPVESVTVLIDLTDFALRNMDYQHVKFLINVLQNYYPESLGLALIVNAPWIFNSCWFVIKAWLDPIVQQKVRFVRHLSELNQWIPADLLPKHLNGSREKFHYLRPTSEEIEQINVIRKDRLGERERRECHSKAKDEFLRLTRLWTTNASVTAERTTAIEELRSTFEQLVPYLHNKTHYHRVGLIQEPSFDLLYQRILKDKH